MRYRKVVISENLQRSFGDFSLVNNQRVIKSFYRHMADLIVEPFLAATLGYNSIGTIVKYKNLYLLSELYAQHRDVVLMAAHYGNWEYINTLPAVSNYDVVAIYSPIKNSFLHNSMLKMRQKYGVRLMTKQEGYRTIVKEKRTKPTLFIVIADQRPAKSKYNLTFLKQETAVQVGAEKIAEKIGAAVLFLNVKKTLRYHYSYSFNVLSINAAEEKPLVVLQKYYRQLEEAIVKNPELWLWSHRRWL
ncbi:lysophospholipid acyltransferase family protein [Olivibacter sp. SDN3]|nr:lysophospholipid acyltransferase family protein [Olivibacter sp. SDN3]